MKLRVQNPNSTPLSYDGAPADQIRYSMSGKIGSHRFSASGDFSMKPAAPAEAADSV